MPEQSMELLDNRPLGRELGAVDPVETWWVERPEALERVDTCFDPAIAVPPWRGSLRGSNKPAFLPRAPLFEPQKSLCTST
jgi:hypothetical protein